MYRLLRRSRQARTRHASIRWFRLRLASCSSIGLAGSKSASTRSSRLYEPELPDHACAPGSCIPRPKPRRYSVASACDHLICWCLRHSPVPHHAWRFSPFVPPTSGATEPRPFRLPDPPSWQPFALLGSVRRRVSRPVRRVGAPTSWMPTHRRAMALSIATRHFMCREQHGPLPLAARRYPEIRTVGF